MKFYRPFFAWGFSEQPAISAQAVIKSMKNRRFSTVDREIQEVFPVFPVSRVYLAQQGQQSPASQPQIGQRKQCHDLPGILRQTTVADFYETKLALEHAKRVLNNGAHRRQHPVERFLIFRQLAAFRLLARRQDRERAFLLD